MNQRERPEPDLGEIDDLDTETEMRPGAVVRRQARARRRGVAIWVWLLVLILSAAAAALYLQRDQLRGYFPGSETRELLNAAARAEVDGRWHGTEGGNHALALYRRVLVEDPDNDAARLGLRRVGDQLVLDAEAAVAADDEARVNQLIQMLSEIGMPGDQISELRARIERHRLAGQELASLLEEARSALARRQIRGDQGALAGFKRMLALDPDNAVALRGIDDALSILLAEGIQAAAEGRRSDAESLAEAVAMERPQHAGLPPLRLAIADALKQELAREAEAEARAAEARAQVERESEAQRARTEREVESLLARADAHLADGRLDDALNAYQQALASVPDRAEAVQGRSLVAQAALDRLRDAVADSDPSRAEIYLRIAGRAGADSDELARAEDDLSALNERLTAVLARPALDVAAQQRLEALMSRAREAEERGDLVEPVGASAYDLYRQVLAVDPMHEEARRSAIALPRRAQTLIIHRIELGQLDEANDAIHALQAMAPMDSSLPELRRQLASAWLERGGQLVRTGADVEARRALERARALVPNHPGISSLSRELSGG